MKSPRKKRSTKKKRAKKPRPRMTPKPLLVTKDEPFEMAKRRCLMILNVLSGEMSVSAAIEAAKIPRPTYYLLENKALEAMLQALSPEADGHKSELERMTDQVEELEEKIKNIEKAKRRFERLLLMTRKVVKSGPMTTGKRRKKRKKRTKTSTSTVSQRSAPTTSTDPMTANTESETLANSAPSPSIPTKGSAVVS